MVKVSFENKELKEIGRSEGRLREKIGLKSILKTQFYFHATGITWNLSMNVFSKGKKISKGNYGAFNFPKTNIYFSNFCPII